MGGVVMKGSSGCPLTDRPGGQVGVDVWTVGALTEQLENLQQSLLTVAFV